MRKRPLAYLSRKKLRAFSPLLLLFIALLMLASASAALAQERRAVVEPGDAGSAPGSITGRIVGEDGRPAGDIQVYIFGVFSGGSARGTVSDSAGRFQFNELQPGFYTLRVFAPSFIEPPDENRSPWEPRYFRPGDSAQLTLVKGGVITGTVLSPQGEPVTGMNVRVIRVRDSQGRRISVEVAGSVVARMTDDRGVYRLYGLQPGSYLVIANGNNPYFGGVGLYYGDTPVYYPSSTRDTASEVTVRAGEEATGIDIRYRSDRGNTVSGTISGTANLSKRTGYVAVVLTRAGTGILEAQGPMNNVDGKSVFSLGGIPDGEYEISTQAFFEQGDAVASAPRRITVRGADVTGVELSLAPLASITGRVTVEPLQGEQACVKVSPQLAMRQTLITARLEDQDKERLQVAPFSSGGGAPNEQGEFLIRNLSSGLFRMNIRLPGDDWYLRAISFPSVARAGNAKATATAAPQAVTGIVSVKRGERTSGINITLAQGAASLRGRVTPQGEGAATPANLRIYLVPVERERADDILRYAETNVAADGSFAFNSLAPGRYLLALRTAAPQTDLTQPPRMLAWDEEGRRALRREAEEANNALELKPCQQLKDYSLSFAAK